jgi:hypothetical protein
MKFQLFLNEITQEMIGPRRFQAAAGWVVSWTKSCCVLNFFQTPEGDIRPPDRQGLLMRAEPDGGLIWSPATNAVYKIDDEAYKVLRDLDAGHSERETAKRNKVTLGAVKTLLGKVTDTLKPARK